jgi:alpha-1,2-mannosyltransferase
LIKPFSSGQLSQFPNQSIVGASVRMFGQPTLETSFVQPMPLLGEVLRVATTVAIVGAAGLVLLRSGRPQNERDEALEVSIALTLCILLSPIAWAHYFLLLLVPAALYFRGELPNAGPTSTLLLLSGLAFMFPPVMILPSWAIGWLQPWYSRLLVSHVLLGGMLVLASLLLCRMASAAGRVARPKGRTGVAYAGDKHERWRSVG